MKKIYCLFFLALLSIGNAQIITQSFNEPVVGDVDKNYRLDTSAYTSGLPVSITGTNCVWNFASLFGTFPLVVDSFIAPSAAIGGSAYPTASYAQHRDLLYNFYKSTTSPQQTELLGAYSPSLSLTFTNSAIIANYPVSYGYNINDPVSGSFKDKSTTGACNGNITISVPGTGTVNLPGNVAIPNVICLKSVEILTLSIGIFPFGTFNQTIYNYYMPGKKFPIFNINYTTYQLIAGTPTITAYVYGSNNYYTVAGLNNYSLDAAKYRVFPNPFTNHLFVSNENVTSENEFLFYTSKGELILKTQSPAPDDLEKLSNGIYFLEVKNKTGTYHQKIIKE
jgi:hypothetical protein